MVGDVQRFTTTLFTCHVEMYVHAVFCDTQYNSRLCVASNAVNICRHVYSDTLLHSLPADSDCYFKQSYGDFQDTLYCTTCEFIDFSVGVADDSVFFWDRMLYHWTITSIYFEMKILPWSSKVQILLFQDLLILEYQGKTLLRKIQIRLPIDAISYLRKTEPSCKSPYLFSIIPLFVFFL